MKTGYRILALAMAALITVQAMVIAYAMTGVNKLVNDGGVIDKAGLEAGGFTGAGGFTWHQILGERVIPVVALALFVISFFVKLPGAVRWGSIVFGLTLIQVTLGTIGTDAPLLGLLHGLFALLLFGVAVMAAKGVGGKPVDSAA